MTRSRLATLAASLALLAGCVGPSANLTSAQRLEAPPRAHTWAFSAAAPSPDVDAVRPAVRAELARHGWLEAPAGEAEYLVQLTLTAGDGHLQPLETPVLDLLTLSLAMAATRPDGPPTPGLVKAAAVHYTKRFELLIGRRDGGKLVYAGQAVANDTSPGAGASGVALARALLRPFPGKTSDAWTDRLPVEVEHPAPLALPPEAPAAWAPASSPAARAVCAGSVPVVVGPAPVRRIPSLDGEVAFQLAAAAPGCAHDATRGQLRVVLVDGRGGYVPAESVRYDPVREPAPAPSASR